MTPTRRTIVGALGATLAFPVQGRQPFHPVPDGLANCEEDSGGRLGVAIIDTGSGRIDGHRVDERFGMCSTFKLPLAAAVLAEIDARRLKGERILRYSARDLVPNSPITKANVARGGMTILDLAKAIQQVSDNTAANLLIRLLGGPEGVTARFRALGDRVSRLDRYEPGMNIVLPGEVHDTTTPLGMARGMQAYLLGNALSPASRRLLIGWMVGTKTGARRLRAGLPADWTAGDKTGSSWNETMVDKINDVAIVMPPGRAPLIITAYLDAARPSPAIRSEDEAILAAAARIIAKAFS